MNPSGNSGSTQRTSRRSLAMYALPILLSGLFAWSVVAGEGHKHADDFVIGVSGSGQLKFESEPVEEDEIFSLAEVSGIINGWAGDEPGFMPLQKDEPKEDFFPMAIGAEIQLVVVSLDLAFKAHTPGFADVLDSPGDAWTIATVTNDPLEFDDHPTWHIDSDDVSLADNQVIWSATFKFVDVGTTGYTESEPFTLRFSNADIENCVPGDVNLDGRHNRADACDFIQAVEAPSSMTPDQKCAADADGDGFVTEADAVRFYKPLAKPICNG